MTMKTTTPEELLLQTNIRCLLDRKAQLKGLETMIDDLEAEIMTQVFQMPDVFLPDGKISYMSELGRTAIETKTTRTISREMLVAQGVEIEKIEAATNTTQSKPYVRIYPAKAKAPDSE